LLQLVDNVRGTTAESSSSAADNQAIDGVDQSLLLRDAYSNKKHGSSSNNQGRLNVVMQNDAFGNCSAIRSGEWKLIVGPCGDLEVIQEPSGHLMLGSSNLLARITEHITNAVDAVLGHDLGFFFDYVIVMQYYCIKDVIFGTHSTNLLHTPIGKDAIPLEIPTISDPNLVQLFNLTADPYERNNVALAEPLVVARLLDELQQIVAPSLGVLQHIGGGFIFARMVRAFFVIEAVLLIVLALVLYKISKFFSRSKTSNTTKAPKPATVVKPVPTKASSNKSKRE
jgi:hypothetical protein